MVGNQQWGAPVSREKDKNVGHVLQMLRTVIAKFREGGVTSISIDDLEQAVENVEAKHRGR